MGQVPAVFSTYLVIGDGRLARHFCRYLTLENFSFLQWTRGRNSIQELAEFAERSSHVLLAISDGAIEPFLQNHQVLKKLVRVHFSGSQIVESAIGAHPLMTFSSSKFYSLETYRGIPFVIERGTGPRDMPDLLPGLRNPSFPIDVKNKPLYHALCVLAGNFTTILWEKAFREFSNRLDLPKSALEPYLLQTAANLARSDGSTSVLTGPLARGDRTVIARNLRALDNDPFQSVYAAFVDAFERETPLSRRTTDEICT